MRKHHQTRFHDAGRAFVVVALLASAACLEPPGVGRAADPGKAPGPAPWGSATTNQELEKKLRLLNDVLDGTVTPEHLAARMQKDWPELDDAQRKRSLTGVTQLLDDLNKSGRAGQRIEAGPDREMAVGQLYFSERRFIEAATIFSKILDAQPTYPNARNLLARCFFFLGNRDRTIEFVRTTQEDLRSHTLPHPVLNTLDAYQWILLISAHSQRRTAQIEQIKAHPNFPKD